MVVRSVNQGGLDSSQKFPQHLCDDSVSPAGSGEGNDSIQPATLETEGSILSLLPRKRVSWLGS